MANATFRTVQLANNLTAIADDDIVPVVQSPYGVGDDGGYTGAVIKESIRDVVAAFLVEGADISITHDDPNDTLTIAFDGTVYTDADARDAISSGTITAFNVDNASDAVGIVDKGATGDDARIDFKTAGTGHAQTGLTGDDDFHIKVSPDNFSTSYTAITIDKDSGNVGIGTTAPVQRLHLYKSGNNLLRVEGGPSSAVGFEFYQGVGKLAQVYGVDNEIRFVTNSTVRMRVALGVRVGSPTGGDKGAGTLNAQAVYDDNALLSCYVFDQALDGAVDVAKWDAKVPDRKHPELIDEEGKVVEAARVEQRTHEPLRKFTSRIGTVYDPLTLDGYAKHWQEKRHLTSLPNEATFDPVNGQLAAGEWVQRLVETVEIQAVLIEHLNQRVKALEKAE